MRPDTRKDGIGKPGRWFWLLVLLLFTVDVAAAHMRYGLGTPRLDGWCRLPWGVVCAYGAAVEGDRGGLVLYPAPSPPGTGFQISIRDIPGPAVLFVLESAHEGGWVQVSCGEGDWESISIPQAGQWWLAVEDFPSAGVLRLELGPYADELLISSIYYRCTPTISRPSPVKWGCWEEFLGGMVVGAIVAWLLVWVWQNG